MKNKRIFYLAIAVLVVTFILAVASGLFLYKNYAGNQINCTSYGVDACPDQCVICPPCEVCSSIACQTEEFYKNMGFNKSWYLSVSSDELSCNNDDDCVLTSYMYECCGAPCFGAVVNKQAFEKRQQWTFANCGNQEYCPSVNCILVNEKAVCDNNICVRRIME